MKYIAYKLVLDTFENSSAEQVPSECSQSRYIADIFNKDIFRASPDIFHKDMFQDVKNLWKQVG